MTTARLSWKTLSAEKTLLFSLYDQYGEMLPVAVWGHHTVTTERGTGSVGHLYGMLDDGTAVLTNEKEIGVPFLEATDFTSHQLAALGLPDVSPFTLRLDGSSPLFTAQSFNFRYAWIARGTTRPDLSFSVNGLFLENADQRYTLLSPFYELVEKIDAFNQLRDRDLDARTLAWADIKELLPDDTVVPNSLQRMNIMRADALTLDFSSDQQIHPVLLSHKAHSSASDTTIEDIPTNPENNWTPLPGLTQEQFTSHFMRTRVNPRYALPNGNWYIVIPPSMRKALQVVKQYQAKPIAERLFMLHNPIGVLKDALADELDEKEIESIFEEHPQFMSKRITGLGVWKPKAGVYVARNAATPWLPPEELLVHVAIGQSMVSLRVKDIPELFEKVQVAQQNQEQSIEFNGSTIPITQETVDHLKRIIGIKEESGLGHKPIPTPYTDNLVPMIIDNIESAGYTGTSKPKASPIFIPSILKSTLYPHQKDGLRWLQEHWNAVRDYESGSLLADDMGLGKTLQALAFLAWLHELQQQGHISQKPFLIVAPTGLLKNWKDEAAIHLADPGLGYLIEAFGDKLKTSSNRSMHEQTMTLREARWVLTTYETLRDRIQLFMGVSWGAVIFDEAQKIKNPTSRMTEMAKSLDAEFTLAMTGTPIENALSDLWSIFDTTNPGLLGAYKDFKKQYEADPNADANRLLKAVIMDEVTTGSSTSYMLRRLKEDHIDGLPEKKIIPLKEEMTPSQAQRYGEVIAGIQDGKKGQMLEALHEMRKISLLTEPLGPEGLSEKDIDASARLRAMLKVLDEIHQRKEKALLFIEYLDLQDALIPYLQNRYSLPYPPSKISGKVGGLKRKELVDIFQNRPAGEFDIMLLSPKAGGVGLTLTAANHVIHLTRWWNPAVEDQCTDRAYRIGQKKTVNVYLPMAIHPQAGEHSFDYNLHVYLDKKRQLSREVLEPIAASENDIEDLYNNSMIAW